MSYTDEALTNSILSRLDRPVVLIGLMGAGKTRIGRMLAESLGVPFSDADDEIEEAAGMAIPEIFDRFGEAYFRDGERRVMRRLLVEGPKVIATGGGAVMNENTAREIWESTCSVWVKADIETMVERTGRTDKRPLLAEGNPEVILRALAEKRYPLYEKADITIESHTGPPQAVLNILLDKLNRHLRDRERARETNKETNRDTETGTATEKAGTES